MGNVVTKRVVMTRSCPLKTAGGAALVAGSHGLLVRPGSGEAFQAVTWDQEARWVELQTMVREV